MACGNIAQSARRVLQDTQPSALVAFTKLTLLETDSARPRSVVHKGGATPIQPVEPGIYLAWALASKRLAVMMGFG